MLRLVTYITASQGKNHRVGEVFIANCVSTDPLMAAHEMLAKQLLNTRAKSDKTYHLLVSFRFGEEPTKEILQKIEAALCAKLGFGQHQRVAAVHRDTDHVHMHIAINKIHPRKLTIHNPYYDFDALGKACAEIERTFGIDRDNHQPTGKTRGERQARDIEAITEEESLHTWIRREVLEKLQKAESWDALHAELAKAGLTLSLRGAGVVVTSDSGHRVTGGNIHRSFSKFNLEKRLGKFQPRPEWCAGIEAEKEYQGNRNGPTDPLRREYETLRDGRDAARDLRLGEIALDYTGKKKAILAENKADRARARVTRMERAAKRRLYTAIHGKFRSQMERLKAETKRARKRILTELPSQNWEQWLREQTKAGRTEAVEALRKRAFSLAKKNGAALRGEQIGEPAAKPKIIPEQKIDGVTKLGTVIYDLGADAVRDDGESFRISAGASAETDVMALKMARRRFGNTIVVDGDRAFRERMIKAAVEGKVYIKFADPAMERKRNELFRTQYRERKERQRTEHGPAETREARPPSPERVAPGQHDPARGDGHASGERPEHGHGRDEDRGTSLSR